MMTIDVRATVVERLIAKHGWHTDRVLGNVVLKAYETATAPHEAVIRLIHNPASRRYWLSGEYYSEGRNALSACFDFFPDNAEQAAVEVAVDAFVARVEAAIGDTYAVRLLRVHGVYPKGMNPSCGDVSKGCVTG